MQFASLLKGALATALVFTAAGAMACGESLFRVGKGVNYRAYVAPLPGNIIVIARTPMERELADALTSAGHDVEVVADASELGTALGRGNYDIVLARFSQREAVEAQLIAGSATYLPVASENSDEVKLARELYSRSLSTDDGLKRFLKTIHRTLRDA